MKDLTTLEATIQSSMTNETPAVALAILFEGESTVRGFGRTSGDPGTSFLVTEETLFLLGSVTKSLTATAIMRLVEQDLVELDRPICSYAPDLQFSNLAYGRRVTLRHLLSHTAGLPSWHGRYGQSTARDPEGLGRVLREILPQMAFVCPPGRAGLYSSPAVSLAGYIAETISGKPFAQLMREQVFEPLHMHSSTLDPLVAMTYPLAMPHRRGDQEVIEIEHGFELDTAKGPAGMAFSSARDLSSFAQMHLNEGRFHGHQYLSVASIQEMQRMQIETYTLAEGGYGLGFFLDTYKGIQRVWHDGGWMSFRCYLSLAPEQQTAVILLCDGVDESFEPHRVINTVFDTLLDLPAEEPPPHILTPAPDQRHWPRYVGEYLDIYQHGPVSIQVEGERLVLHRFGRTIPLSAIRPGVYTGRDDVDGTSLSLGCVPQEGEEPLELIILNEMPCIRYQREAGRIEGDETWLQQFIGVYTGSHTITLRYDQAQGVLYATFHEWRQEYRCTPVDRTRIHGGSIGLFTFSQDEQGRMQMDVAGLFTLVREQE